MGARQHPAKGLCKQPFSDYLLNQSSSPSFLVEVPLPSDLGSTQTQSVSLLLGTFYLGHLDPGPCFLPTPDAAQSLSFF